MKKLHVFLTLLLAAGLTACWPQSTAPGSNPKDINSPTLETASQTTETEGQIQLNGTTLVISSAEFGECALPGCPADPKQFLLVTLQALDLASEQYLDYKNLPGEIAVKDNTDTVTPYSGIYNYVPDTQQLTLYFAAQPSAADFLLLWPGSPETPFSPKQITIEEPQPTLPVGLEVSYGSVSLVLPPAVAGGISGSEIPRVDSEDAPWWERTPGYTLIDLGDSYALQGKTHQPQIYIYPAEGFTEIAPSAAESIQRLRAILSESKTSVSPEQLPIVPFFNAAQAFAAQFQRLSFQNGDGVRFLTEYGQYPVSANNSDLFYEFQGLSADGTYYIIAVFPVTHPALAETSTEESALPDGGIPYNYFTEGINFDAESYYGAVMDLLNSASQESFNPTLNQLDALIQSLQIMS